MRKKLIITEEEKNDIRGLYGLENENNPLALLLKAALGVKSDNKTDDVSNTNKKDSSLDFNTSNLTTGNVELKGNFNSEQEKVIKLIIDEMEKQGIKDPLAQIGILSVIDKESGFRTYKEIGYGGTSDSRIESVFGKRGTKCKHLKKDNPKFFDCVYGKDSGVRLGNDQPGDGWKYVGRGLNGITGKANYRKYGNMIGVDLVGNPEQAEDPRTAAKIAIAFFTKGKPSSSFPKFNSKEDSVNYFADLNAGRANSKFGRTAAIASSSKFDVDYSNLA